MFQLSEDGNEADIFEDSDSTQSNENSEYTAENRRHLKRLEDEFLQGLEAGYFVRDWLQTVMFNSFNVFLTLYCIQIGIGLFLAVVAGFSIGSLPGFKNIGDNFRLSLGSEEKQKVHTNGKFLKGLFQLALAGVLTYNAASEWRTVLWMAQESKREYMVQVDNFERPNKTEQIDPKFGWMLGGVVGGIALFTILGTISNKRKD